MKRIIFIIFGFSLLDSVLCKYSNQWILFLHDIKEFNKTCVIETHRTVSECFMMKTLKQLDQKLNKSIIELNANAKLVKIVDNISDNNKMENDIKQNRYIFD